jgi:hypothetical protein
MIISEIVTNLTMRAQIHHLDSEEECLRFLRQSNMSNIHPLSAHIDLTAELSFTSRPKASMNLYPLSAKKLSMLSSVAAEIKEKESDELFCTQRKRHA